MCGVITIITDDNIMKTKKLKMNVGLTGLLFGISLLLVSCKQDPCKDVICQNGGTPEVTGKSCGCDCPRDIKANFVRQKLTL